MPTVSVNGLKLNYLVRGDGPPMILSHGFQNSGFAFTPIQDRLAERFVVGLACSQHGDGVDRADFV